MHRTITVLITNPHYIVDFCVMNETTLYFKAFPNTTTLGKLYVLDDYDNSISVPFWEGERDNYLYHIDGRIVKQNEKDSYICFNKGMYFSEIELSEVVDLYHNHIKIWAKDYFVGKYKETNEDYLTNIYEESESIVYKGVPILATRINGKSRVRIGNKNRYIDIPLQEDDQMFFGFLPQLLNQGIDFIEKHGQEAIYFMLKP